MDRIFPVVKPLLEFLKIETGQLNTDSQNCFANIFIAFKETNNKRIEFCAPLFGTEQVILRAIIQCVKSNRTNLISQGYEKVGFTSDGFLKIDGSIKCMSVNNSSAYFLQDKWRMLHSIIGDEWFLYLLHDCNLFEKVQNGNYIQLTGRPLVGQLRGQLRSLLRGCVLKPKNKKHSNSARRNILPRYLMFNVRSFGRKPGIGNSCAFKKNSNAVFESIFMKELTDAEIELFHKYSSFRKQIEGSLNSLRMRIEKWDKSKAGRLLGTYCPLPNWYKRSQKQNKRETCPLFTQETTQQNTNMSIIDKENEPETEEESEELDKLSVMGTIDDFSTIQNSNRIQDDGDISCIVPPSLMTSRSETRKEVTEVLRKVEKTPGSMNPGQIEFDRTEEVSMVTTLESIVPDHNVFLFVRKAILQIVPPKLLGNDETTRHILNHVETIVKGNKYASLAVTDIMKGLSQSAFKCFRLPKTKPTVYLSNLYKSLIHIWLYHLFGEIVIPLIRRHFYVTQREHEGAKLFYYRKPIWAVIHKRGMNSLSRSLFKPIDKVEAASLLKEKLLGVGKVHFLPKEESVRPITNLSGRSGPFLDLENTLKKQKINSGPGIALIRSASVPEESPRKRARLAHSSTIHVSPSKSMAVVRTSTDNNINDRTTMSHKLRPAVASRLKSVLESVRQRQPNTSFSSKPLPLNRKRAPINSVLTPVRFALTKLANSVRNSNNNHQNQPESENSSYLNTEVENSSKKDSGNSIDGKNQIESETHSVISIEKPSNESIIFMNSTKNPSKGDCNDEHKTNSERNLSKKANDDESTGEHVYPKKDTNISSEIDEVTKDGNIRNEESLLGATVSSYVDIHKRLVKFLNEWRQGLAPDEVLTTNHTLEPLFFASLDISKCFDTINCEKLLDTVKKIFADESNFRIRRSVVVKPTAANTRLVSKSIYSIETRASPLPSAFTKLASESLASQFKDAIFHDTGIKHDRHKKEIIALLEEHLKNSIIQDRGQFFQQTRGIPQGSVLSSLLCNLHYADYEKSMLDFLPVKNEICSSCVSPSKSCYHLLLRLTDDFLLITNCKATAQRFSDTLLKGSEEYGLAVNAAKTKVNFDVNDPKQDGLSKIQKYDEAITVCGMESGFTFSWCGLGFNTKTGEVSFDSKRTFSYDFRSAAITVRDLAGLQGQLLTHLSLKLAPLVLDTKNVVTSETAASNIFQAFLVVAARLVSVNRVSQLYNAESELASCRQLDRFLEVIEECLKHSVKIVKRQMCIVSGVSIRYLGLVAFHAMFTRKHSMYKPLKRRITNMISNLEKKSNSLADMNISDGSSEIESKRGNEDVRHNKGFHPDLDTLKGVCNKSIQLFLNKLKC